MTWCLNEYSDIFRCLLCWTVLPNVIFFLFTRAFQRIGSINCIYQQPSFQGGSVVFSHVQSEQRSRILVVCHPPHRTFHQAQRQVRRKEIFQKKIWLFQQRDWQFFCTLQQIIVISDISPPSRTCLKSMISFPPFPPGFAEVSGVIPLANVQGCSGAGSNHHRGALLAAPFHWTKNMGKTSWETPLLCLECWVYFQYIQIYPRTVFGQAFLLMATPLATFGSERLLRYWKVLEVFARLESSSKYDSRLPEGNYCNYSL